MLLGLDWTRDQNYRRHLYILFRVDFLNSSSKEIHSVDIHLFIYNEGHTSATLSTMLLGQPL